MNMSAFWNMSYGVYVVSTMDDQRPVGCIANSSMQITAEPATIAVSINKNNYSHDCIVKNGSFSLSILPETCDPKVIGTFGFMSSKNMDKFDTTEYQIINDLPVLSNSCGHFICKVINTMDCDTHTVFLGTVEDCDVLESGTAMTYDYYHKVVKGKAPKNAPTYIPDELLPVSDEKESYVCSVCSYEYDGDIPFEDLDDDYVCPICGEPKSIFVKK
ncbi:MAG: flavin reductase [Clostridia bacterium]